MSLLSRLLNPFAPPPPAPLQPLWDAIVAKARQPEHYLRHAVADSIDGRFDMVALFTSLVMLQLEQRGLRAETALLTERFVADMDGSLRDIGIGDLVVGKHVTRMAGALGGRLGAYRDALAAEDAEARLAAALARNVYRGADRQGSAPGLAAAVLQWNQRLAGLSDVALLEGRLP